MKSKIFILTLFINLFTLLSINAWSTETPTTSPQSAQNSELVALIITLDKNEIAAGKLAAKKATHSNVKAYANLMVKHHTQNLSQIVKISHRLKLKASGSSTTDALKKSGQEELISLKNNRTEDFDLVYINNMIKDHQNALTTLSNLSSNNSVLQKHLEQTQAAIKQHLEKAQAISEKLSATK